jgi:hypothetical protein
MDGRLARLREPGMDGRKAEAGDNRVRDRR